MSDRTDVGTIGTRYGRTGHSDVDDFRQSASQYAGLFTCIILLLVLNLVLVPSYGYTGAAAAVIFTTVYLVVALDTIVRQKLGFSVSVISRGK